MKLQDMIDMLKSTPIPEADSKCAKKCVEHFGSSLRAAQEEEEGNGGMATISLQMIEHVIVLV